MDISSLTEALSFVTIGPDNLPVLYNHTHTIDTSSLIEPLFFYTFVTFDLDNLPVFYTFLPHCNPFLNLCPSLPSTTLVPGDRAESSAWLDVHAPLDVVLFEGWMLGFTAIDDGHGDDGDGDEEKIDSIDTRHKGTTEVKWNEIKWIVGCSGID